MLTCNQTSWPADEVKRLPEAYQNQIEQYKKNNKNEWRAVGAAAPAFVARYSYDFFVETEALPGDREGDEFLRKLL